MEEVTIQVQGMTCGGCVSNVNAVLQALPGVEQAQASLPQSNATVRFDPAQVSVEQLRAAVEEAGFDAPA